ncbi:MAG TPA: hypothetical protein VJX74_09615 [Blastocatellia bacterium]|nr:hypothetical protein [Blastocatellia bacterium]
MKKIIMLTAVLFIASACAAIASAQTSFGELNADRRGTGAIRFENQREEEVTSAVVILRRGGDAEVRLTGRTTTTFKGRWSGGDNNIVDLNLTSGFGYGTMEARGRVTLTRGGFDRLELNGRSRGRNFTVTFDAERRGPGGGMGPGGGNRDSDFIGTYRSNYGSQRGGTDTRLIRVLKIIDGGRVELVSRYQGRDPDLTRTDLSMHGTLLRDIRARKTIVHTGTWRSLGRRLEVTLTSLDGNRSPASMTLEFRNNNRDELVTTAWDRALYGSVGFEFKRNDSPDDDADQNQNQDPGQTPNRLAGTYSTRLQVPDSDGDIERSLQLLANGDARLTTEWMGGRTLRTSFRAQRELGRMIRDLENQRTITQNGRWRFSNNQIIVDFDNLDRSRQQGSITFDVRGFTTLESVRMDQDMYGDRRFTLTRTTR